MVIRRHPSRAGIALIAAGLIAAVCGEPTIQAQTQTATPGVPRAATAPPPRRAATRDAVSDQEFKKQIEKVSSMDAQMEKKTKPLGETRPAAQSSLLTGSLFLTDGQMFTVIPIGSVLNLPVSFRNRVITKPEGSFTFWPSFLKRNASWLAAKEVPLKMAKGDEKAAQAILREAATDNRVVVAVYKGGPITILEPVPDAEKSPKSASKNPDKTGATAKRNP